MLTKIRKIISDKLNDSYEFKPLLSEIEESPSNPLGHFMFWTITALIIVTVLWLILGKIDVVVNARGVVIPDGEAKIIQAFETGVVDEILVQEGEFVHKGQLLIEINSKTTDAKLKSIEKNLAQSNLEARRLKASGTNKRFNVSDDDEESKTQQELYKENLKILNSEIKAKNQEISQIQNQINSAIAQKKDYEFQLNSAKDKLQRLKEVIDIIAYNNYQEQQDRVNSLIESLNRTNSEILRLKTQQLQIKSQIAQIQADFKSKNLDMLANTQKQIKDLEADKEQIEFSNINQKIVAPTDGYIDKLLIHTIGGIVTPAQELIALTPVEKPLLIKATVLNKDVGFIKVGMPVSIKIDTFDFQKYGILKGKVKSISKNSINDEQLGLVYEVYIQPEQDTLTVEGKEKKISTGMTLNAEIEINKRRIIEFFIYPLIKYMDEGISVR